MDVIGIIGPIGAGKDTAAEYLAAKLGIPHFQISAVLKYIAQEKGIPLDRKYLIALSNTLVTEYHDGYLAEYILQYWAGDAQRCIISGMRHLGQIAYLKQHSNLTLIALDADPLLRFQRADMRGRLGEATTLAAFINDEQIENSPPNNQRLFQCMALADYMIVNDGGLQGLWGKLDEIASGF